MARKEIKIGLFGFGCVGQGLYAVLSETRGLRAEVLKICVKSKDKQRSLPASAFTFDKNDILEDESINVVVELIDDAEAAFEIVKAALQKRKAVVTANKKMVAEHFEELLELQQKYDTPLLYEAACCASIPIIRNLEEYYDNDLLNGVEGIFNGTTNYILTNMINQGVDYTSTLKEAQAKGFAETDPTLDVTGQDARYKLTIIIAHAFGLVLRPEQIFCRGIDGLNAADIRYAREKGLTIKLVASCRKIEDQIFAYVIPQFVPLHEKLAGVNNEYNGVQVESVFAERQFFSGKGAGSYPTGSAVLSDISALTYDYRYEYKKLRQGYIPEYGKDTYINVYLRYERGRTLPFQNLEIEEVHQSRNEVCLLGRLPLSELNAYTDALEGVSLVLQPEAFSYLQDYAGVSELLEVAEAV